MLLDSSLMHDYTHLGYNKKLKCERFKTGSNSLFDSSTYKQIWENQIKTIMIENKIQLVILLEAKMIDKELELFFSYNKILCLKLKEEQFNKFKQLFQVNRKSWLVYIDDFELGKHVLKINSRLLNIHNNCGLTNNYLLIECGPSYFLFSIMIEAKLQSTFEMYKEALLHIIKRIENILKYKTFIRGNIEHYLCSKIIEAELDIEKSVLGCEDKDSADKEEAKIYISLAKIILSNAFRDMELMRKKNFADQSNDELINFDDYYSKIEAWRLACSLNIFFLQTDFYLSF